MPKKLTSYFSQKILRTYRSQYNGEIQVLEYMNQKKILAQGLLQSGSIIKNLWQKPLKKIKNQKIKNVLLLGLGGGTIVKLLNKNLPDAKITALEIDPIMIDFAAKYFEIKNSKNLKIINDDAFNWFAKNKQQYDLIIIDLFKGKQFPEDLYSPKFLNKLKNQTGTIIINCLFFDEYKKKAENFIKTIEKYFDKMILIHHMSNLFIIIKNK